MASGAVNGTATKRDAGGALGSVHQELGGGSWVYDKLLLSPFDVFLSPRFQSPTAAGLSERLLPGGWANEHVEHGSLPPVHALASVRAPIPPMMQGLAPPLARCSDHLDYESQVLFKPGKTSLRLKLVDEFATRYLAAAAEKPVDPPNVQAELDARLALIEKSLRIEDGAEREAFLHTFVAKKSHITFLAAVAARPHADAARSRVILATLLRIGVAILDCDKSTTSAQAETDVATFRHDCLFTQYTHGTKHQTFWRYLLDDKRISDEHADLRMRYGVFRLLSGLFWGIDTEAWVTYRDEIDFNPIIACASLHLRQCTAKVMGASDASRTVAGVAAAALTDFDIKVARQALLVMRAVIHTTAWCLDVATLVARLRELRAYDLVCANAPKLQLAMIDTVATLLELGAKPIGMDHAHQVAKYVRLALKRIDARSYVLDLALQSLRYANDVHLTVDNRSAWRRVHIHALSAVLTLWQMLRAASSHVDLPSKPSKQMTCFVNFLRGSGFQQVFEQFATIAKDALPEEKTIRHEAEMLQQQVMDSRIVSILRAVA